MLYSNHNSAGHDRLELECLQIPIIKYIFGDLFLALAFSEYMLMPLCNAWYICKRL